MRTSRRITKRLFQCEALETAEGLLDELSPHRGEHLFDRPDQGGWIFRGQAEAVWPLRPAALRKDAFKGFIPGQIEMPSYTPEERRNLEAALVNDFVSCASAHGFEIPGDSQRLRDREHSTRHEASDFPPLDQRGLYALAQHYRVPTRLLDWTRRPLFAAYFAALGAADPDRKPDENGDGRLAVWAVQAECVDGFLRTKDPGAVVVSVPTISNPNLRAQRGEFTLVRFRTKPKDDHDIPDLDRLMEDERNVEDFRALPHQPSLPMMFKFTLPHSQARRLLHYLDVQGANHATVYPGLHSIAAYMREASRRSAARPPRGDK